MLSSIPHWSTGCPSFVGDTHGHRGVQQYGDVSRLCHAVRTRWGPPREIANGVRWHREFCGSLPGGQMRIDGPLLTANTAQVVEQAPFHTVTSFSHLKCAGVLRDKTGLARRRHIDRIEKIKRRTAGR